VNKQRLQKILATQGIGSRRIIEGWISAGEVMLNGKTAQLGDVANSGDLIEVRGQKIPVSDVAPVRRVLIYHKPEGEINSTSDPEGRPTVFGALPSIRQGRWISVGRLDFNTSGLLLVTNDGELANRLMHPSNQIERTYAVRVLGGLTEAQIKQLTTEVQLDDGPAKFDHFTEAGGTGANRWYHVTLREGRNREVRRMVEAVGGVVSRLIRISYGGVALPPRLKPGRAQDLPPEMEDALVRLVGLKPESRRKVVDEDTMRRALKPYRARTQEGRLQKRDNESFYQAPVVDTDAIDARGRFDAPAARSQTIRPENRSSARSEPRAESRSAWGQKTGDTPKTEHGAIHSRVTARPGAYRTDARRAVAPRTEAARSEFARASAPRPSTTQAGVPRTGTLSRSTTRNAANETTRETQRDMGAVRNKASSPHASPFKPAAKPQARPDKRTDKRIGKPTRTKRQGTGHTTNPGRKPSRGR
jgi:23S rRNA pseudouridine2605 synthase